MATNQPKTPISNRGFNAQFLSIAPLHQPLVLDRVVASIDSIRVKYTYPTSYTIPGLNERLDMIAVILSEINNAWYDGEVEINISESKFKLGNFMYTAHITCKNDTAFAILVGRFSTPDLAVGVGYDQNHRIAYEAVLDVNPNKVPEHIWKKFAGILSNLAVKIAVSRFDLALDFPFPRDELSLERRPGSARTTMEDPKGIKTQYLGKRSQHGAVKLYDKGADLDHPDLNVTRCEITIDPKKLEEADPRFHKPISALFPTITTYSPLQTDLNFETLPFPVQAVILHPDLYERMKKAYSGNTWRKYKAMIQEYGQTELTLSPDEFKQIDRFVWGRLRLFITAGSGLPITA